MSGALPRVLSKLLSRALRLLHTLYSKTSYPCVHRKGHTRVSELWDFPTFGSRRIPTLLHTALRTLVLAFLSECTCSCFPCAANFPPHLKACAIRMIGINTTFARHIHALHAVLCSPSFGFPAGELAI